MISNEREKRCDDMVLRGNSDPLDYARALLHLSIQQSGPGTLVPAATGSGKGELKNRIERILKPNTMKINYREKTNALLIFLGGVAVMLVVSGFTSGLSISRYSDTPEEAKPASIQQISADTLTQEEKKQIDREVEEAIAGIDWEVIKMDVKVSIEEAMAEIDWEKMKSDIDEAQRSATEAMKEIDWEDIRKEMEEVRVNIDLMMKDFQIDMDLDMDSDIDVDVDVDVDVETESLPEEKD